MSDGAKLFGVEFDVRTGRRFPYYEQQLNYEYATHEEGKTGSEAVANLDQVPTDRASAKLRVYDVDTYLADQQAATPRGYARKLSLGDILPPVLNSITVHFNKSSGTGTSDHLATDQEIHIDVSGSGSLDPRSTAQASASIVPAVTWDIDTWHQSAEVDAIEYELIDVAGKTVAELITRLNTQLSPQVFHNLPIYKKKSVQLVLKGSQISLQQSADSDISISFSMLSGSGSHSKKKGFSNSVETGVNVKIESTPYVIHGTLSLSSAEDSQSVTVTVKANVPAIPLTTVTGITNEPPALTGTASGSVVFSQGGTSLGATTPASIDTSKIFVVAVRAEDDALGTVKYILTTVNFAQYAG